MNRRDDIENTVGFDQDLKKLGRILFRGYHPEPVFISIFGESGVGKTTLAKVVLKKFGGLFDIKIKCFMIPGESTDDLLGGIYKKIQAYFPEIDWGQQGKDIDVTGEIRRLLDNKRYLMVLGGISSKTTLNCVRASLPYDNTVSSVVLVLDIESEEVAWHANTMNKDGINRVYQFTRMDVERSGELFRSRAFRKELSDIKPNMGKYNKIVYDITGGHPLSIVVLAGLLRFKEKPLQWKIVLQQLMPAPGREVDGGEGHQIAGIELQMNPTRAAKLSTSTAIERIFWASFEDLPNDLKPCFLYFAVLQKTTIIDANEIVRMWIDEGFIKPQKGKTMEELGHGYLKELALRCLVDIKAINVVGGIEQVGVHKTLHGFLQSEAREAGLIDVHDIHDAFVPPSVRRLCFQINGGRYTTFKNKFPKLRSFICFGANSKDDDQSIDSTGDKKGMYDLKFLLGSKFLRVIIVEGTRIKELPKHIGNMMHLRHLCVSSNDLNKLPSSIRRLFNLQTLDIRHTEVKKIHPGFWKIKTLRHVLAEKLELPKTIEKELRELQTLQGVMPSEEGEWNRDNCPLHKMTKLRTLELRGVKHDKHGAALKSALAKMQLLVQLNLKGDKLPLCVFTALSLRYLQQITLDGSVKWPQGTLNVRTVRPNLVSCKLEKIGEAPQHIREELRFATKEKAEGDENDFVDAVSEMEDEPAE